MTPQNTQKPPKTTTPTGLSSAGRALWRSVVADFDLDAWEASLLLAACRTADRLDALAAELADAPQVVENHRGDAVAHPLIAESRQQALALSRLLASLRLPSGEEDGRPQRRGASRGAYAPRLIRGSAS